LIFNYNYDRKGKSLLFQGLYRYQNIVIAKKVQFRVNPTNWRVKDTRQSFIFARGYTMHEHLDNFGAFLNMEIIKNTSNIMSNLVILSERGGEEQRRFFILSAIICLL